MRQNNLDFGALARDQHGNYSTTRPATPDELIALALSIVEAGIRHGGDALTSPAAVRDYLRLRLGRAEREIFACLFLDNRHRVIQFEELFAGTLSSCTVHPREVVRAALRVNAAAVIFVHNHPSGVAEPSHADERLTRSLRDALTLVEVRVLDHVIVAGGDSVSFAERGLL